MIILDIRPQTKERHRYNGRISYTPAKTRKYEEDIAKLYRAAGGRTYSGAVNVRVSFRYKTTVKKKMFTPKTSAPDIDNLLKSLFDGLSKGGAWSNDAIIFSVEGEKLWADDDYIILRIEEIKG